MSKSSILLTILLGLVASPVALAAPPPSVGGPSVGPQEEACKGRAVGAACTLPNQQLGICATSTCNRLDYSQGSPPKSVQAECLVCQEGEAGAANGPSPGEPPMVGSGGPPNGSGGADSNAADGAGSTEPPTTSSRCSVGDRGAADGRLGLAVLGLLGLGLGLGRRARRAR